jgi:hypothetical protein
MTEEDLQELFIKVKRLKNDILFEEPCPIYDNVDDDLVSFWISNDK